MSDKIHVTLDVLIELSRTAFEEGTEDAFIRVALDWARQADAEIERLQARCAEWEAKAMTWMASPEAQKRLDGYRELAQRAERAEAKVEQLRAKLGPLADSDHICLLCGKAEPCMTDEEAQAHGGPGAPCTFDPTPQQLWDDNKKLRADIERLRADAERYRWLRRDAPYDECAHIFDKYSGDELDAAIDAAIRSDK